MKPLLLVRNDGFETYGLAVPALRSAGAELLLVDAFEGQPLPALSEVAGVVMLGGTVNADQVERHPFLLDDRRLTRQAVDAGVPYLGICLGAQILARAMDRPVVKAARRELGFEPVHPTEAAANDPLLSAFADGDRVFQWHQDTFELPDGAMLLATGEDVPHQAFRVGERAWGIQKGRSSVVVAVLDTGVAYEDFGPYRKAPDWGDAVFLPGFDFVNGDDHPNDDQGHGTHVASTIAEATNNGEGVAGLAFGCRLLPVKVLNAAGEGFIFDVAEGVDFAVNFTQGGAKPVKVINLSLGGVSSETLRQAVDRAVAAGITVVAAAGNEGSPGVSFLGKKPLGVSSYAVWRMASATAGGTSVKPSAAIRVEAASSAKDRGVASRRLSQPPVCEANASRISQPIW